MRRDTYLLKTLLDLSTPSESSRNCLYNMLDNPIYNILFIPSSKSLLEPWD